MVVVVIVVAHPIVTSLVPSQLAALSGGREKCPGAPAWAVVGVDTVVCDPSELGAALVGVGHGAGAPSTLLPLDHVHPTSHLGDSAVPLVVYVTLGTPSATAWHSAALGALKSPDAAVQYALRHVVPLGVTLPAGAAPLRVPLQGFGVGLDSKNMEYKALDDRAPGVRAGAPGLGWSCCVHLAL